MPNHWLSGHGISTSCGYAQSSRQGEVRLLVRQGTDTHYTPCTTMKGDIEKLTDIYACNICFFIYRRDHNHCWHDVKFLEHFFSEEDAKFLALKGLNSLRLPFNYRHFEDDSNPRVLKEEGFKHLDRVIDICARHGIYTILDMHTAPGGQNADWHSDNSTNYAAFWDYKGKSHFL